MKAIEERLRQAIGLDPSSLGPNLIESLVSQRMNRLGLRDVGEYKRLLERSAHEWSELVESVVVTETWFFRDHEPFRAFAQLARQRWLPSHHRGLLRVLSVPCSSGEEPYSVVMALLDAGFPAERLYVEGVDVSERALEKAWRAVYGSNSFRGVEPAVLERFFRSSEEGYALDPCVRKKVYFHRGNLVGESFAAAAGEYDFVFCRNLLIYLDAAARRTALRRLHQLVAPGGMLFVGAAEVPLAAEQGFMPAGMAMAFACNKTARISVNPKAPRIRASRGLAAGRAHSRAARSASEPAVRCRPAEDLAAARSLADAGKLVEAAEACRAHLLRYGASAAAYYLLGLVHDAHNQSEAAEYYRKALYLEPDHGDSLWQMALMAQKNGDLAQAREFKRRAQRAQPDTWTNCE
jgi:chemotaxis protein methyltransferase WspC